MNAPYLPDMSLKGKVRRRLTRFASRKPLPLINAPLVSFTFDDFPKSAALNGASVLAEHDALGTYYLCTGQMGSENHFGEICDATDVRKLASSGHEIGCHTENHVDCAVNHPAIVHTETRRNRAGFADLGLPQAKSFAFPYGDVSAGSKKILAEEFESLRGVQAGINHCNTDANQLLAVPLEKRANPVETAQKHLRSLREKPGWLIFFTHDVREDCSDWGCTPSDLSSILHDTVKQGISIGTVTDQYSRILAGEAA